MKFIIINSNRELKLNHVFKVVEQFNDQRILIRTVSEFTNLGYTKELVIG